MCKAENRINGTMKAITGVGLMCAAACGASASAGLLGLVFLPLWVWGGMRSGAGVAQAVTGWDDN